MAKISQKWQKTLQNGIFLAYLPSKALILMILSILNDFEQFWGSEKRLFLADDSNLSDFEQIWGWKMQNIP